MATYFIGAGLETYQHSPTLVTDQDGGIRISPPAGIGFADGYLVDAATGLRTAQKSIWAHIQMSNNTADGECIVFRNSDGIDVFRLTAPSLWNLQAQRRTGGAWVNVGDPVYVNGSYTFDFRIVVHPSSGRLAWVINGTSAFDLTGLDTSDLKDVALMRLKCPTGRDGASTTYSGAIVASYNTIGHTVRRRTPNGDVQKGWTGSYADVDESINDDSDAINTSIVGAVSTFTASNLGATAPGNVIKAVAVSARIRNDGGDVPRNAQAVLTIDGVDYSQPYNLVVGPGFSGASTVFDLNPATGQKWGSIAEVNQPFGLRATD